MPSENDKYKLKLGYPSSHSFALGRVRSNSKVLDIGGGQGFLADEISRKGNDVTVIDKFKLNTQDRNIKFIEHDIEYGLPNIEDEFSDILLLDVLEHLVRPEDFLKEVREHFSNENCLFIVTVPNLLFISIRLKLFFGMFSYESKGILDRDHKTFFTKKSVIEMFEQSGFQQIDFVSIPAPFPVIMGLNKPSKAITKLNEITGRLLPGLFSYQFGLVLKPKKRN